LSSLLRRNDTPREGIAEGVSTISWSNTRVVFRQLSNYPVTFFVTNPTSNIWAAWWDGIWDSYLLMLLWIATGFGIYWWIRGRQISWETEREQRLTELESANQNLEAFAYSIAHDLRAPLRTIDGFGAMLMESLAGKLGESEAKHFQRIRAAAHNMARMIEDLLRLAHVLRAKLVYAPIDLSAMVQTIATDLAQQDPGRKIRVAIQPGLVAIGDAGLVEAALNNLLQNAWKFTSKTPEASIEFGRAREGEGAAYFVRDNGAGFDMAYAKKLFGVFQRLHNQSEFEGTGVGLAIVQRIIERHHGKIWAQGAVGAGATFYFSLPEAPA